MGRKATMLLYIATIALVLATFAFIAIKVYEKPSEWESKYIGEHQLALLKTAQDAEQFLLYLDQSAKFSAEQSLYTLAKGGGYSDKSGCSEYLGYTSWLSKESKCYPFEIEEQLSKEINDNLYSYLYSYRNYPVIAYNAPAFSNAPASGIGGATGNVVLDTAIDADGGELMGAVTGRATTADPGSAQQAQQAPAEPDDDTGEDADTAQTTTAPKMPDNPSDLAGPLSYFPPNNYDTVFEDGKVYGLAKDKLMMPIFLGEVKEEAITPQAAEQGSSPSLSGDVLDVAKSFVGSPYVFGGANIPDMATSWGKCWKCIIGTCAAECLKGPSSCGACIKAGSNGWQTCKTECSGNLYCPLTCKGDPTDGSKCSKGCGPSGFDCSGLVGYSYWKARDAYLPRVSRDQYKYCTNPPAWGANCFRGKCNVDCYVIPIRSVEDYEKLQPGDLLFYDDKKGSFSTSGGDATCVQPDIHHVALYAGKEDGKHRTYEAMATNIGVTKGYIDGKRTICGAARVRSPAAKSAVQQSQQVQATTPTPSAGSPGPIQGAAGYNIVVQGSTYKMWLYNGQQLVKEYNVGIGLNGMGKTKGGDRKTPIGDYKIKWKASKADGTIKDSTTWCKNNNLYYGPTGPSGEKLWSSSYGGSQAAVMGLDYPNAEDRSKGYTGGCIEIHATLSGGIGAKSSQGCVRMNPGDANELYSMVGVGTPVRILG